MRVGHILHLSGLNRDTYNSLARRGHLSFMSHRFGDTERERGLTVAHALALVTFNTLRRIGLETAAAARAVDESWPDIVRTTGLNHEPRRSKFCGVRLNDIGVLDTWGWPHSASKGGAPVAHTSADLDQLWLDLQPAIAKLEYPDNSVDDDLQDA